MSLQIWKKNSSSLTNRKKKPAAPVEPASRWARGASWSFAQNYIADAKQERFELIRWKSVSFQPLLVFMSSVQIWRFWCLELFFFFLLTLVQKLWRFDTLIPDLTWDALIGDVIVA